MRGFRTSSISGSRRWKRRLRRSLSSRILIQLPRGLTLFVSVEIIHALVPLTKRFHRDRGSPRRGLDSGGPAVVGPPGPIRPVTLRRHLSVALPLSKSRRNLTDQIRSFSKPPSFCAIPFQPPASRRWQEVNRVHDGHSRYLLRTEIDRPDAANHLRGQIRRIHISRLQRAHRHAAVGLDRQAQNHLPFQGWVIAKLPVVQPVERRLVAIKDDLYFFVGAGGTWPAACFRSVGAGDRGDPADCAAYPHTTVSASAAAAHIVVNVTTATATASATASNTAAQRSDVNATARTRRSARQHRASRRSANIIGGNVARIGSERHHDGVLCQARELLFEG